MKESVPGHRFGLIVAVSLAPLCTGCHVGPDITGPMRGIWVTRFDYKTAGDVKRIISNCARGGFNTVLFQVRGNGTTMYPSAIEPWAEQFDHQDPGFDPLALAISESHRRGLQLHAWVNVMPAWRGPEEPAVRNQLYFTHPEWFWVDADGKREPLLHEVGDQSRGWYVSVNPCLPEVRNYLVTVFREIAHNYDIDGLHLDYIRFPNEPVIGGEKIPDYPRDPRTLDLYRRDTGLAPDDDAAAWNAWRCARVTELVGQIHHMLRQEKPQAVLSAAVGSVPERALKHFQDSKTWIQTQIIDTVILMNYAGDLETFADRLDVWEEDLDRTRLVPGLWFDGKLEAAKSADVARSQIETALQRCGHFCVFAYSLLFESSNDEPGADHESKTATRREILLSYLQRLAANKDVS